MKGPEVVLRPRLSRRRVAAVLAFAGVLVPAPAALASRQADTIPDRYIVVFEDSVRSVDRATAKRERAHGFKARHRYRSALKGFAAKLSRGQLRKLRNDAAVDFVAPDRPVHATAALAAGDSAPTGIRRIGAATSTTVNEPSDTAVAVIDTGIDLGHPDLAAHVSGGVNCIDSGASAQDDHGHGTHVAGTIAAANNGGGVVGVAPGTRLYAVKVLDHRGSGSTSSVVCGIDWVTRNEETLKIRVANMSLGGPGSPIASCSTTTDAQHRAICASTAAGVAYAVAAGNDGWDFDYAPQPDVPAAYPQVVTVAAMADSDGAPGGYGASCSREGDDRYASFSNFALTSAGAAHTMAAPGVCVVSTALGGGTTGMSGTSMATPHVAGALALCISEGGVSGPCAPLAAGDPGPLIAELTKDRTSTYGFVGDPTRPLSDGRYFGYLAWAPVGADTGTPTEDTTPPAAPTGLQATAGDTTVALDWTDNNETDLAGYDVYRSTSGGSYVEIASLVSGSAFTDTGLTNGTTYSYVVRAVDRSGNESAASTPASATPAASTAISLSARGYKVKGWHRVDLSWSGASGTSVDVYRDGRLIVTTANDGAHTDAINAKGGGSYRYRVCNAGSTTCSPDVVVTF